MEEDDYIISDARGGLEQVSQYGKVLMTSADRGILEQFIRDHMEKEQFWPNVWWCSDHGNYHAVTL